MGEYSRDFDILRSLTIMPPSYDFSSYELNELQRCLGDYIVPLQDKLQAVAFYISAAQKNPELKKFMTPQTIQASLNEIAAKSVSTNNDRLAIKRFANSVMHSSVPEILSRLDDIVLTLSVRNSPDNP